MIIAFANNQVMVANNSITTIIYTDPVPMGKNDRLTCHINVEYMFNSAAPGLKYVGEFSLNGSDWLPNLSVSDSVNAPVQKSLAPVISPAAFVRFRFEFTPGAAVVGAVNFDLHVDLDHS
ncbi:MAG: hypothetical protein GZ089_08670 [Aromatoleum sp.]|nr:hypothetical protein [Aromatoleum sp.]